MATPRKQISKGTRFKVFNRDGFTCCYCGQQPPAVVLEVDHIVPVAAGGANAIENLTTACMDCNRGKGAKKLTAPAPINAVEKVEVIKEREAQIRALKKAMTAVEARIHSETAEIQAIYMDYFPGYQMTPQFMNSSVRMFLDRLPFHAVKTAMTKACARMYSHNKALKYFCGICWNEIKGDRQ